ncbi:hypothetical protein ABW19_dt0209308 [Dactylella cylindrospora]|nr:hypothetical protein ABW19_dt0209308 [Dactylella cylindrospora]
MFRPTLRLFSREPNIFRRSIEEIQFETKKIIAGDYLYSRFPDLYFFNAEDAVTRDRIRTMSDADMGGYSTANFDIVEEEPTSDSSSTASTPESESDPSDPSKPYIPKVYGLFHGNISTKLPSNRPHIQRSGYAGWRTEAPKPTIFGARYFDIENYEFLAFRLRTDSRSYFINIQSDSIEEKDLHQHRLFTRKEPGTWETVIIKPGDFIRTQHGLVIPDQMYMLTRRIKTIGFSVIDRVEGPFKLAVHSIWATNKPPAEVLQDIENDEGKKEKLDWDL